jgi:hypothetical protein
MIKNPDTVKRASGKYETPLILTLLLASISFGLLLLPGCSSAGKELDSELGQSVTLSPRQTVSIIGELLEIKFLEVINDSRCPTGVSCPWEGEVDCMVRVTFQNNSNDLVLTRRGSQAGSTYFIDYKIDFNVSPYPQANKTIDKSDYRLQLTVTKMLPLSGGILVTFDIVRETYTIFITNPDTIEQVFAVNRGESTATIPSGKLLRGPVFYNVPWSWHIDSEDIQMAEFTIELCDGTPSQVEANLDYWVDTVQRFCPWSAQITKIEDFR